MPMPAFTKNNDLVMIEVKEIFSIYKEYKSRKIILKAESGEFYLPSTLEQIVVIMEPLGFAQVDKNKIVNLSQVKEYNDGDVTVDGNVYEVSRRRKARFEMLYNENRSRDTNGME